jgi:hypothetical protein
MPPFAPLRVDPLAGLRWSPSLGSSTTLECWMPRATAIFQWSGHGRRWFRTTLRCLLPCPTCDCRHAQQRRERRNIEDQESFWALIDLWLKIVKFKVSVSPDALSYGCFISNVVRITKYSWIQARCRYERKDPNWFHNVFSSPSSRMYLAPIFFK